MQKAGLTDSLMFSKLLAKTQKTLFQHQERFYVSVLTPIQSHAFFYEFIIALQIHAYDLTDS